MTQKQKPNDQRSNAMNPNNPAHQHDQSHREAQRERSSNGADAPHRTGPAAPVPAAPKQPRK